MAKIINKISIFLTLLFIFIITFLITLFIYTYLHIKFIGLFDTTNYNKKIIRITENITEKNARKTVIPCNLYKTKGSKLCFLLPRGALTQIMPSQLLTHPSFFVINLNYKPLQIIKNAYQLNSKSTPNRTSTLESVLLQIEYTNKIDPPLKEKLKTSLYYLKLNISQAIKYHSIVPFKAVLTVPYNNIKKITFWKAPKKIITTSLSYYAEILQKSLERLNSIRREQKRLNSKIISCNIHTTCRCLQTKSNKNYKISNLKNMDLCNLDIYKTFPNVPNYDKQIVTKLLNNICIHKKLSNDMIYEFKEYLQSYITDSPLRIKAPVYFNKADINKPNSPINTINYNVAWIKLLIKIINIILNYSHYKK